MWGYSKGNGRGREDLTVSRTFVTSDDETVRVELIDDNVTGEWRAYCSVHSPGYDRYDPGPDLLRDSRERFNLEDAQQLAANHVDHFHS